ncbi:MAG: uncharacterized protein QOK15_3331 [Nocardioidaceae bacterium]|nr:uncharacterized protein [Nocardioidaceae bacterium]
MLILLPPSEGKVAARRGAPLDHASLSLPALHEPRAQVLDALVTLCTAGTPEGQARAREVLGLGPTQAGEVTRNASIAGAPTARADQVYAGVLYEALDVSSLPPPARRRATSRLAITSALLGLVRPADRIPAYRLSGQVSLPGVGPIGTFWGRHLGPVVAEAAGAGLVIDLRSSAYTPFWRPPRELAGTVVTVRVLHEVAGRRAVVSHFNKATKGRLVRDLLIDGSTPRRPSQLVDLLGDLGWVVETPDPSDATKVDVVVSAL